MASKDTRTAILDSAQDLIQRVGVNAMSFRDISETVGIRKASIHHHFPSKDDLVVALVERYSDEFLEAFDRILATKRGAQRKLADYAALFEAPLRAPHGGKMCLCGMLGAELAGGAALAVEGVTEFYRDNIERLADLLEEGRRSGAFGFEGPSRNHAGVVFSLLEGAMLVARAEGGVTRFQVTVRIFLKSLEA